MKQIFAWLFAAIFFAAGCAQSPDLAEPVRGGGYENADGLVIVAACPPATRTDIEEGKSTWEAGDRITVVYDGAAYEYTAAEAGRNDCRRGGRRGGRADDCARRGVAEQSGAGAARGTAHFGESCRRRAGGDFPQYLLGHRTAYRRRGVGECGAVADRRAGR